ncbi:MAG: hypothetical protein J6C26_07715 [Clostridia bacterium]|nr:hypothetical protein [Clostridia bacterium]
MEKEFETETSVTPEEVDEFDFSNFDFTIHDPGEDPAPATPAEEPPLPREAEAPLPSVKKKKKEHRKKKEEPLPEEVSSVEEPERRFFGLPNFAAMTRKQLLGKGRHYLRYALRPSGLYENLNEPLWGFFLLLNCLFGGLFYLLVALDWSHADLISAGRMWAFVLTGCLVGGAAALAFAGGTSLLAKIFGADAIRPFRMLSAVAGAAVCPAAVMGLGLILSLFGCSVSMSFGVIALLWWIFTLTEVLRDLLGKKYYVLTFITLWGFALFALITVTFSLK